MADVSHHGLRHPRRNHHINCHRHGDVSLQNLTVLPLDVIIRKPKMVQQFWVQVLHIFQKKKNPRTEKKSQRYVASKHSNRKERMSDVAGGKVGAGGKNPLCFEGKFKVQRSSLCLFLIFYYAFSLFFARRICSTACSPQTTTRSPCKPAVRGPLNTHVHTHQK